MDASDAARAILSKPIKQQVEQLSEDWKTYKRESMEAPDRKWWGRVKPGDKNHGRFFYQTGPHTTAEEAAKAVFETKFKAKEAIVGFGNQGGHFEVRTVKRTDLWPEPAFGLNDTYNVGNHLGKGGRMIKEDLEEHSFTQGAKEQGIAANLAKRGWKLKDSGQLGATYIRKGVSIMVDKDTWNHQGATGKDIDSLEGHLKHYFSTKRSDVKEEKEDKDDDKKKKGCHCKEEGHTYKDGKCTCCGKKKPDGDKDDDDKDDKDDKKDFKKFKKEETELVELSKGKLKAYAKASNADATDRADRSDSDSKIDKRVAGSRRAIRKLGTKMAEETVKKLKEAAANAPDPELYETLGFDTGALMEVTEFSTTHVHAPGGEALGGSELVAYHQRMMAHHQALKDLAVSYAGAGDAARWNALAAAHAKHCEGHAKWLEGINKSAKGFPTSGSAGGGVSESYRDELLNEEIAVETDAGDTDWNKDRLRRALGAFGTE